MVDALKSAWTLLTHSPACATLDSDWTVMGEAVMTSTSVQLTLMDVLKSAPTDWERSIAPVIMATSLPPMVEVATT
jgi:hypothetical protein